MKASLIFLVTCLLLFSCGSDNGKEINQGTTDTPTVKVEENPIQGDADTIQEPPHSQLQSPDSLLAALEQMNDSAFVEMNPLKDFFAFDMKYGTTDNFLGEKVYDCPKCLLRSVVAKALLKAGAEFKEKGYTIKFFDCFRPLYIQKRMWAIKPDSRYVANPNKSGSIHNRGAAVDITLIDSTGKELEMGTKFDHFGEEAHHGYTNLPKQVLENRLLLKEIMEKSGFKAQNSEWWHYSFSGTGQFPLSDEPIRCD